ncbi:MAG: GNAT family N-acetyltransferase [Alteromonadaceae bacterium]|jgi:ribosomal protein S18 acetylase RimI-like enzyme|tara:strand:+ start:2040 stop:2486 length:447 start_codon:yes stop_codon:yes gene_type:complete
MNDIITPITEQDLELYYQFRWQLLRQPWLQPLGSEKDELEQQSIHRMIMNEAQQVIAVGRLHQVGQREAQIRYMAVDENHQGQGLGKKIIQALEDEACKQGVTCITLNARESAVRFYENSGYQVKGFSHLLYNELRHITMTKTLALIK